MHKLLERQLRRQYGDVSKVPADVAGFVAAVNAAYEETDADRALLERSLELTSQELTQRYAVLRTQQKELQVILDSVPAMIWFKDGHNRILRANRAAAAWVGKPLEMLEGMSTNEIFPNEAEKMFRDDLEVVSTGKPKLNIVQPATPATGDVRWLRTDKIPYSDDDGRIIGVIVMSIDITAQKQAEEKLKSAYDQLKELDRFRTQFINNAAHELGTPLTPIKLQIHMLRNNPQASTDPGERKSLEILDRSVDRLGQLVNDVLDAARLQAGRLHVTPLPTEVHRSVAEVVDVFREPARLAKVSLEIGHLDPAIVMGDPRRLIQVWTNLVSNGIKFTPAGGRIILDVAREGNDALVRVEDSGLGIRSEDIPKLFQPFSQVHDPMQRTRAGTGLGLYISRGIVEDMGGTIWCESAGPGRGTTFLVRLPLARLGAAPEKLPGLAH